MIDAAWVRSVDAANLENSRQIQRIKGDGLAQQSSLKAGLDLLPERVQEISAQSAGLSIPISGTQITYTPNLSSIAANTWTTVQDFTITAPPGKARADVVLIGTSIIGGNFNISNFRVVRLRINGTTYVQSSVGRTGVATGGGSFVNATVLNISAQVYIANPAEVANDTAPGRANCMRTFYMAVWS